MFHKGDGRTTLGTIGLALAGLLVSIAAAAQGTAVAPTINEFVFNHTGSDTDEFIEVFGDPNTDYSAYTILEIEGDDGSLLGNIDDAFTVGTTDANGIWQTGIVSGLENGTVSLLLVEGFTGLVDDDIDLDDDGVIDNVLWTTIADDIGVLDDDGTGFNYSSVVLTADFDGGIFTVGGASRIPDGFDTDDPSDWLRNDFDGEGLACCTPGTPEPGEAINTPGLPNEAVPDAGLSLEISGTCPGTIDISISGATPDDIVAVLFGTGVGNDPLPGGPCVGTETGLMNPGLITTLLADANGEISLSPNVGAGPCGADIQALDGTTCEVSNVANVP